MALASFRNLNKILDAFKKWGRRGFSQSKTYLKDFMTDRGGIDHDYIGRHFTNHKINRSM